MEAYLIWFIEIIITNARWLSIFFLLFFFPHVINTVHCLCIPYTYHIWSIYSIYTILHCREMSEYQLLLPADNWIFVLFVLNLFIFIYYLLVIFVFLLIHSFYNQQSLFHSSTSFTFLRLKHNLIYPIIDCFPYNYYKAKHSGVNL